MKRNLTGLGLTLVASLSVAACSGGSSDSDGSSATGTLTLGLIDTPVYDIRHICIVITDINVKPREGEAINFGPGFTPSAECDREGDHLDLLSLRDVENPALLLDDVTLEAGRYDWIELVLDAAVEGRSAEGNSYIVMDSDGSELPLRVPSGSLRLVSGFSITANRNTHITLDWDARRGLSGVVNPPGLDGALLRPAFRIIDMTESATLSGEVSGTYISSNAACTADDAQDLDVGNVVYIYEGLGVDPYPEGEDAPEPLATVDVLATNMGDYAYETLLSPGDYTVLFTCQGDLQDMELELVTPDEGADLSVEDGDRVERNFLEDLLAS